MSERDFETVEKRSWQVVAKNEQTGEPEVFDLHYKKEKQAVDIGKLLVRQAPPVRITPSRAKMPEREFEATIDIPDLQIDFRRIGEEYKPIHNERAMKVARFVCLDVKPDNIIIGGDNVDMSSLSRFEKDSNHFSGPENLQMAIDTLSEFLGHLRSENPHARIVMLEGNHDKRLSKYVLKNAEKLYGLKRANSKDEYPINTLPFLLRLDEMDIEYVSGYPASTLQLYDDLIFIHGDRVRNNGSTAELYTKEYDQNVISHHTHRIEMHSRTSRSGKTRTAASFGTMSDIQGAVPSYGNGVDDMNDVVPRFENWQNGMGFILRYPDGYLEMHPIHIQDGVARLMGREYQVP